MMFEIKHLLKEALSVEHRRRSRLSAVTWRHLVNIEDTYIFMYYIKLQGRI